MSCAAEMRARAWPHRLSTAARADRVAVLRDGKLVAIGAHDELVERGGFYAQLWQSWASSAA